MMRIRGKFRQDGGDNELFNRQLSSVEMMKIPPNQIGQNFDDVNEDDIKEDDMEEESLLRETESCTDNSNRNKEQSRGTFDRPMPKPFTKSVHVSLPNLCSILFLCLVIIFILSKCEQILMKNATKDENNLSSLNIESMKSSSLLYQCSSNPKSSSNYKSANDQADAFKIYDRDDSDDNQTMAVTNLTQVLHGDFDGWRRTYFDSKAEILRWKLNTFGRHLKSGDSIYESACGVGLNLLLTLEALEENLGITNLTVYGNDYLQESVDTANSILDTAILSPDQRIIHGLDTKKGSICWGDSTNLGFVPSDAFDLVFTGYIDPIVDPLNLATNITSYHDKRLVGISNCKSKDPDKQDLANRAQKVQEDWFAMWLKEMIRIAKPGKIIIVEEVAPPVCEMAGDRGGVNKTWWSKAIHDYGWDVLPKLYIEKNTHPGRYNVMLRKNE